MKRGGFFALLIPFYCATHQYLMSRCNPLRLAIERAAAANIIDVLLGNPPRDAVNRVVEPQRSAREKFLIS
jgi:hypothetical protein